MKYSGITISFLTALAACQTSEISVGDSPEQQAAVLEQTVLRADMNGEPMHIPGLCRLLLVESPSANDVEATILGVMDERRSSNYSYGIYKLTNGNFAGAYSFDKFYEDPARYSRINRLRDVERKTDNINRYIRNGWYPPTARCSDGREFVRDIGVRVTDNYKSSGGLLGAALIGMANAIENAGNAQPGPSRPLTTSAPTPSSVSTEPTNSGVQRSSDGYVTVDGKRIGRTWFSFGYHISCNRGYNSGYGSSSAFGGSFIADVGSMNEAVGVVLAACKR